VSALDAGRFRRLVAVATAIGLLLRGWWMAFATRTPDGLYDMARYLGYGDRIARGQGYLEFTGHPTAYYPPGYPYFVGVVTWLVRPFTDDATMAVAAIQVALGTATIVLVAYVARRLGGRLAGVVAAVTYALYPNLVMHTGVVLGETLNIFLTMAFLALVLRRPLEVEAGRRLLVGVGVLLGLALLVRPVTAAIFPVVVLGWWFARRDLRSVARSSALAFAGVLLCVTPWIVRNAIRMDAFVPMSTNTGDNLCIGYQPDATGAFAFGPNCAIGDPFQGPASEIATDEAKTEYALEQIKADPGRVPWLVWRRAYFTWVRDGDHDAIAAAQDFYSNPWMAPSTRNRLARVSDLSYWAVGAASVVGAAVLVRRRRPEGIVLVGSVVVTALLPLAFFGESRFKVPAIPLLIVIGAVGVVAVIEAVTGRRERHRAPPASADPAA
jgi:hypothetical protein